MPHNCINILNLYHDSKIDFHIFYERVMTKIDKIITDTVHNILLLKSRRIFSESDYQISMKILTDVHEKSKALLSRIRKAEFGFEQTCQSLVDKLFVIICSFGTQHINDVFFLCNFVPNDEEELLQSKFNILQQYLIIVGINKEQIKSKKSTSSLVIDKIGNDDPIQNNLECFDTDISDEKYYQRIHGITATFINKGQKITIKGIIEHMEPTFLDNLYVNTRIQQLYQQFQKDGLETSIIKYASLKDLLIYSNGDFKKKYMGGLSEVNNMRKNKMDVIIDKFSELSIYNQRSMLINLLTHGKDEYILFITNILYEIILLNSNDYNRLSDLIQNSLSYHMKLLLKECASFSVNYSHNMSKKYDTQNVTLEQQIYLLKVSDKIKEKALMKFKEVRSKNDYSHSKAKQYLEGLVKIPFGVYKSEKVLSIVDDMNISMTSLMKNVNIPFNIHLDTKTKYTVYEINKNVQSIESSMKTKLITMIESSLQNSNIKTINKIIQTIQSHYDIKLPSHTHKKTKIASILSQLKGQFEGCCMIYDELTKKQDMYSDFKLCKSMEVQQKQLTHNLNEIRESLDKCIHSHNNAKDQIFKIIAQWINGKQSGYCFGFEGSPGIGKTSLAKKGLSQCLRDENGDNRPFSFIALGGSTNGSSLEGHNYTYMNSTWGRIVDILMESKCMNPIIYIDELDKVSNTEHGKEIIGILTHIIDNTQNNCFQDKFFAGIDIDLSKVLFIFSYNDPSKIDKILLDRIHRIRFDNLNNEDKIVISEKYLIPEIEDKMGFDNVVTLEKDVLEHVIENYTCEPGVRKLKEIIFDIFGEINVNLLADHELDKLPITISKKDIDNIYLRKYHKNFIKSIHHTHEIGTINGLWANTMGKGGIIPVQTLFFPSSVFLELKLTGLQGDVMKESMNVAKTLAWNLTEKATKTKWLKYFNDTKCQGLHIHCPEGSISKDGPSAGTAITTAIYSLFNSKPIPNDIAITGEITLKGDITAIGGLYEKIHGGIQAGIKTFIIPKQNLRELKDVIDKYNKKNIDLLSLYQIHSVERIEEVFSLLKL